ncbi:MAG TPA: amino acid permease [Nitrososphaerales archaeon]
MGSSGLLKREISLFGAVTFGVGMIVGAGIYALIGEGAGLAGNSIWLSFILAAIIAASTGLSYAELSSIFPVSSAEYMYVKKAFGRDFPAFIIGWLVLASGIISASAIALGFAGYLISYINIPESLAAIFIIIMVTFVNLFGVRDTVRLNAVMTIIEVLGLVIVVFFGARFWGSVNYFESPMGFNGILTATALIFFAFIGFESIAKIGEETRDPAKTLPRAIILSLIISTLLFVLVSISVVSIMPYDKLSVSTAPLSDVVLIAQGEQAASVMSVIALIAISNTLLIIMTATSRIAYGMAKEKSLPTIVARVLTRRGTPWVAILLVTAASIPFALLADIDIVANVTNLMLFLVFLAINLSVIVLSRSKRNDKSGFKTPFRIGNIPVTAVLGAISSFLMLLQFQISVVLITLLTIVIGAAIYVFYRGRK